MSGAERTRAGRSRLAAALAAALTVPLVAVSSAVATDGEPNGVAAAEADAVTLEISEVDLDGPLIETVTVTVTNTADDEVEDATVSFAGPIGWSVNPRSQDVGDLAVGEEVALQYQLRVPSPRSGVFSRTFTAQAQVQVDGQASTVHTTRTQVVGEALPDLAAAYNNVGVTTASDTAPGNFDGDGNSFSAEALAAAGVEPGSTVEGVGASFTWPDVPPGEENNVATAGQTIELSGQGSALAFLGSAAGAGAGPVTVIYTDGSSTTGSLGFPNWCCTPPDEHGATTLIEMAGRHTPSGPANQDITYRVYGGTVEIDPDRTVAMVTLPSQPGLHIFDMALVG